VPPHEVGFPHEVVDDLRVGFFREVPEVVAADEDGDVGVVEAGDVELPLDLGEDIVGEAFAPRVRDVRRPCLDFEGATSAGAAGDEPVE
jgi:hypothetical protein